jgi:hypothetical protein
MRVSKENELIADRQGSKGFISLKIGPASLIVTLSVQLDTAWAANLRLPPSRNGRRMWHGRLAVETEDAAIVRLYAAVAAQRQRARARPRDAGGSYWLSCARQALLASAAV